MALILHWKTLNCSLAIGKLYDTLSPPSWTRHHTSNCWKFYCGTESKEEIHRNFTTKSLKGHGS